MKFYAVESLEFNGLQNHLEDENVIFKKRLTDYKNKKTTYYDILLDDETFAKLKDKVRKDYKEVEIPSVIEVFCDGGLNKISNKEVTHTAYSHILLKNGTEIDRSSSVQERGTNQTAELKALLNGLTMAILKADRNSIIVITADSSYAIRGFYEYYHNWIKNGYKNNKKEIIENYQLWLDIFKKKELFDKIYCRHVKAHTKNEGHIWDYNREVDQMCTESLKEFK
jgi:ribonuclease HI